MKLQMLEDKYKVIKLKQNELIPRKIFEEEIYSITRTDEELSIIVKESVDINSEIVENNWNMIKVVGVLDFSLIGILSKISTILAKAEISIFVISTYNTDYIMVKNDKLEETKRVLEDNNYIFI